MRRKLFSGNRLYIISALLMMTGLFLFFFVFVYKEATPASAAKEKPRLTFALWGDVEMQKAIEEVVDVFMRQNDCYVDVYCYSSKDELKSKTIGQIAAGNSYDVFYVDSNTLSILQKGSWLCDLSDVIENRRAEGDEYYATALISGMSGGGQYALPTGVMPYLIYYNLQYFDKYGLDTPQIYFENNQWDFDGFSECLENLHEKIDSNVFILNNDWTTIKAFCLSEGGDFIYENGSVSLDSQSDKTLDKLAMLQEGKSIHFWNENTDTDTIPDLFAAGKIPMMIGDLNMTREFSKIDDFKWDVVPFPSQNSDFSNSVFYVPLIAVTNGENSTLAKKFLDFYVSGMGQKLRLEYGECLIPSLNMTFYTSMGNVKFPDHSNYYFFAIENGYSDSEPKLSENEKASIISMWQKKFAAVVDDDEVVKQ